MDLYREEVMDHYEHPRNQGQLVGDHVIERVATNASCGDSVHFFLEIEAGEITHVAWQGSGCAIATASASKLSEYLKGKKVVDLQVLTSEELAGQGIGFEVNPGRAKCLMLSVTAVSQLLKS